MNTDPVEVLRSLAERLEAVARTLPSPAAGHPAEVAWPMTHLVAIAAEASDEILFRVADPGADRAALAAFAAAVSGTAEALAVVAESAHRLLAAPPSTASEAEQGLGHTPAIHLVAAVSRQLAVAADRLSDSPAAAVTELSRHRRSQASAAARTRSRVVSVQPSVEAGTDTPLTAPVIPLHRRR
ncbi:hypothetical protein ACFC26_14885 [Kitasatospora purpeofusca]|uniref:hypothetical protein n=1 Tax=Kitasatospora purpeofusca TaxID=67352 RepID=UPI0035E284AF